MKERVRPTQVGGGIFLPEHDLFDQRNPGSTTASLSSPSSQVPPLEEVVASLGGAQSSADVVRILKIVVDVNFSRKKWELITVSFISLNEDDST